MRRHDALLCACILLALALAACGRPPAAAPTPKPEPAWREVSGGGVSLSLPESYEALDLGEGVDQRIRLLDQFGGKYAHVARMTEQSRKNFALWAFDTRPGYSSCAATVAVTRTRPVSDALTLDVFVGEVVRQLPSLAGGAEVRLVSNETIKLDSGPAARLLLEFPGACRKEMVYTLKRGDRFWMVIFAADVKEFERRLPLFERSIATFTTA